LATLFESVYFRVVRDPPSIRIRGFRINRQPMNDQSGGATLS
jgi:hypothetical protein